MKKMLGALVVSMIFVSGCGLDLRDNSTKVKGWWLATEMTVQGQRVTVEKQTESIMLGFDDNFQFYVLDGTLKECGGKEHYYSVSGNYISVSSTGNCEAKSADIETVTDQVLILTNVRLGGNLVLDRIVMGALTNEQTQKIRANYKLTVALNEIKEALEQAESNPYSKPYTPPTVTTPPPRRSTTPVVPSVPTPAPSIAKAPNFTKSELEGFWQLKYIQKDGKLYSSGEKIPVGNNRYWMLQEQTYIFHFKNGKVINYLNQYSVSGEMAPFQIEGNNIVVDHITARGRYLATVEIRRFDLEKNYMRVKANATPSYIVSDENDGEVFFKISDEEARERLKNNADFLKLNP